MNATNKQNPAFQGGSIKKVSDWDQAESSAETGRDLVHHFHVKDPGGETRLVSAESLPSALGYAEGVSVPKEGLKSLVSASKTLAKNKMKLAILEQQGEAYDAYQAQYKQAKDAIPDPPDSAITGKPVGDHSVMWTLGNESVREIIGFSKPLPTAPSPERRQLLVGMWKGGQINIPPVKAPYGLYEARQAVARQEKKVKQLASAIKSDKMQNMAMPLQHLTANTDMRVARLMAQGVDVFTNRNGRQPSEIELINIRRKATIVAQYERHNAEIARVTNSKECGCSGVFCKLPEDKLSNRFSLPSDNWYHIAPMGDHPHPKGIVQVIDREAVDAMVQNFKRQSGADPNFPGLLVDLDHVSQGGSTEAAGWIANLDGRADGLWANIRWTDSGKRRVEGGEYRLVSPVWRRKDCVPVDGDKTRCRPVVLDSLGLTNDPNMKGMKPLSK